MSQPRTLPLRVRHTKGLQLHVAVHYSFNDIVSQVFR
jgi:hypothetical protein